MQAKLLDPRRLTKNPFNPNHVSPENMEKLKASITDLGFVTAVIVRELNDGTLQILGGQHRVEAAIALGLKEVPGINLGVIDDKKAKRIGLVDNSRYGSDDGISLAKLYEEIGMSSEELAAFLPFTEADFDIISKAVDIDLEGLDMLLGEEEEGPPEPKSSKPAKTHEIMRFRISMSDAEKIRQLIERTMKAEGLADDDELTAAGATLAYLLLNEERT